ncbi:MAG: hypothetical protein ACRC6R_05315 [Bacteroidales bacterium]
MNYSLQKAKEAIKNADAILIGASNGLSIAEGYHIFANNEMFRRQFGDFQDRFGIRNVIEGCFFSFPKNSDREEFLQRLTRYWIDDYVPSEVMKDLLKIIGEKEYFVLTSNADMHLQIAGFNPDKVFEIEGTFKDIYLNKPIKEKSKELNHFLERYHNKQLVILELGIGSRNRLIKLPIMQLAFKEPSATYITLNLLNEIYIPEDIAQKSIALPGDIAITIKELLA